MKDNSQMECGFCYPREQGTHGEIRREWSSEWMLFIPVCRLHKIENRNDENNKPNGETEIYE